MTRSSWSVAPTAAVRARLSKCTARSTSSTSSVSPARRATVPPSTLASNVVITKLKLDKDRRSILERKNTQKAAEKGKGKHTEESVKKEVELD